MLITPFFIIAMILWFAAESEEECLILRIFFDALGAAVIAFGIILIRAVLQ